MIKYDFNGMSVSLRRLLFPSLSAPPLKEASMLNAPQQSIVTTPSKREQIDFSQAGPVLDLHQKLMSLATVQTIPVRQPGYILRRPPVPRDNTNMAGVQDLRYGIVYPPDLARVSYVSGPMSAPPRLQSVPGYVTRQVQVTRASQGYPTQALKAPRPQSGGGQCNG